MSDDTGDKVLSIVNSLRNLQNVPFLQNKKPKKIQPNHDQTESVRGKPKSGRFWKSRKEKFSTINKTKGVKLDFQKKTELRLELKRIKELSKQKKEELQHKETERKERRRENIKRSEENRKKAEVVQVISNTAKLKRLRKKQLRFIEKRDTTVVQPNKP